MMDALNSMMLDMLAATARKDYEDRRQGQGIVKAMDEKKFEGKPPDLERHERIRKIITAGITYS